MSIATYEIVIYGNHGFTKGGVVHSESPSGAVEQLLRISESTGEMKAGTYQAKVVCEPIGDEARILIFNFTIQIG